MLKRLHVLLLKSYFGPLILTFFISLFILIMQFLWRYIDDLVGKGLEWNIIAELLLYISAGLVPTALPLSILLSSIMTFGNFGEHSELLAMKSSGISLQKIMSPLIVFVVIVSIGAFFFSNNVIPYTNLKSGSLLYDITHKRPALNIREGVFNNNIDGYSIKIGKKDNAKNMMYDIMIYDHTDNNGNNNVTLADSGRMMVTADNKNLILTLFSGKRYEEIKERKKGKEKKYPHRIDKFKKQRLILELDDFEFKRTDDKLFRSNYQMLNLSQLEKAEDSLIIQLSKTKRRFYINLVRSHMLNREVKQPFNDSTELFAENIVLTEKDVELNLDSIYNSLKEFKQRSVISTALSGAQSAQRTVISSHNELKGDIKWLRRYQVEWHKKFSLSFACLVFFFIGAPLGAIIRKGGLGLPVVISILFFILYYIISLTGEKFVRESILEAYQGMWVSSIILLPLGIFLTYKATTDSVILNVDTYLKFFKKIYSKQQ